MIKLIEIDLGFIAGYLYFTQCLDGRLRFRLCEWVVKNQLRPKSIAYTLNCSNRSIRFLCELFSYLCHMNIYVSVCYFDVQVSTINYLLPGHDIGAVNHLGCQNCCFYWCESTGSSLIGKRNSSFI